MQGLGSKRAAVKSERVKRLVRERHKLPIGFYSLKDRLMRIVTKPSFLDAVFALVAFLAIASAFGYYPYALIAVLAVVIFVAALYQPFLGLLVLMVVTLPIFIYQMPALAWVFLFILSIALVYGYMHYRTMMLSYILIALAFSPAGYLLFIPFLILTPLVVGFKRAAIVSVLVILGVIALSGTMGVQNSAFLLYDAAAAHAGIASGAMAAYVTPALPQLHLGNFIEPSNVAFTTFASQQVVNNIDVVFGALAEALAAQLTYLLQLGVTLAMAFAIDLFVVSRRSKFKGAEASLIGLVYPAAAVGIGAYASLPVSYIMPFISFMLAPAVIALLELYNVRIVKALDVKKQDVRMKFGEAFEDLEQGNVTDTFDDIGDYEPVKKELREAVIGPIEQRGVSRAYNVNPVKGIIFFGPPGTGKTMMMRALANELHAAFYYVKSANLISAYPGESERKLNEIFAVAKKHTPCVLFFDEIDNIASSRLAETDDIHRHLLSQFLQEMDGFEKLNRVLIVGATNIPNALDAAALRPGRMDRVIYMYLPDAGGRKKIFEIYLSKLPLAKDVDLDKLAEATQRFSGADVKGVCDSVAQMVAQEAAVEHKIIGITMEDIMNVVHTTKASTSLAQVEEYNKFKLDFERSHGIAQKGDESMEKVSFDDVVGLDDAKKAIVEAIQIPLMHPDLIAKYDIKNINGILLFGPPGTGKTMLMKAVTQELRGVTMLEINGPMIQQAGLDRATATIKETFYRAMENKPAVIFIDEIDGLITSRSTASEYTSQIITEFLQEMDGIRKNAGVVVVASTNSPDSLDPAILRPGRFDKLVFVKPPDSAQRAQLFREYLLRAPTEKGLDFTKLGSETKGFTGADISNVCREAKTAVLERAMKSGADEKIDTDAVLRVIKMVKPSASDIVMSSYLAFYARHGQR